IPPGADRAAVFEQSNAYYDAAGRLIQAGVPLDPAKAAAEAEAERAAIDEAAVAAAEAEEAARRRAEHEARANDKALGAKSGAKAQSSVAVLTPPQQLEGFDRAACFQLGDAWLDENGREIVPGKPVTAEALATAIKEEADTEGLLVTALVKQADSLSF